MAKQTQAQDARRRGGGYPYNSLRQSLGLAEAVRDHGGGRADVPKSVIAQQLGMSEGSGTFSQLVASAKIYGLVDGNRSLRLTEAANEYFFPTDEGQRRAALLAIIRTPPAYRFIIDRFDGNRLPLPTLLGNLLHREHIVPESWAMRTGTMFVTAASESGVVDATGHLRYGAAGHLVSRESPLRHYTLHAEAGQFGAGGGVAPPASQPAVPAAIQRSETATTTTTKSTTTSTVWDHAGVRVSTPEPLAYDVWNKLLKYVQMLEPSQEKKED
jgi:hypothetical protein